MTFSWYDRRALIEGVADLRSGAAVCERDDRVMGEGRRDDDKARGTCVRTLLDIVDDSGVL